MKILKNNINYKIDKIVSISAELNSKKHDRPLLFQDLPFYQNILLLQGPVGYFFYNLRNFFLNRGSKVFKINLNGGSSFFYPTDQNTFDYTGLEYKWEEYIKKFLKDKEIKCILLFGEKRFFHQIAITESKKMGIDIYSLEEGYIRPYNFTLEKNGNNLSSSLNDIDPYKLPKTSFNYKPQVYKSFIPMCLRSIQYWFFSIINNSKFPYYSHHRDLNLYRGYIWIKGLLRFLMYEITEFNIRKKLRATKEKNYFICVLQVFDDFQVTKNSHYNNIEQYLEEVLISFSVYKKNNISADTLLIKHHPMDIGEKNYNTFIKYVAKRLNILDDVIYFHNIRDLNNIYSIFKGAVTINSTLGLKLLLNKIPVINLSRSFYNKKGLTFQGSLDEFWVNPLQPEHEIVRNYINYLLKTTQVNGCLYSSEYKIS
jgi:capsular polysaccharide export protein